jgi:hypothetical protein
MAMGVFVDAISGDSVSLSESQVEALDYARKLYNESVNNVLKNADSGVRESNFLKGLEEFMMKRNSDGSFEIKGRTAPRLNLPAQPKVVDAEVVPETKDAHAASPPPKKPAVDEDGVVF